MFVRGFERRLFVFGLAAILPGLILAGLWALDGGRSGWQRALAVLVGGAMPLLIVVALSRWIRHPLRTLSNQVAGMREGDFSIRVRGAGREDAMGELVAELNLLCDDLRSRRLEGVETATLLRTVMEEISVAIFAFDHEQRLRLVNSAGGQLLGRTVGQMTGRSAAELGLAETLRGESSRVLDTAFDGKLGRWALRRTSFREAGQPHQLVVLTDLSRTLREEERQAWKRLVRVIGHELNNSLAPICSISGSLEQLLARRPRPSDWEEDLRGGLDIIQARAGALSRFMEVYSRLARLPAPSRRAFSVSEWAGRVVRLEPRLPVRLASGPEVTIHADPDQLDQVLINLVRNAADAALADAGGRAPEVEIQWHLKLDQFVLIVRDNGPGLAETGNLFVPFFTTKPGGSGIGLALCRQIVEGHDGTLSLSNRTDGPGAEAVLRLPLSGP
ncbi:MAG: PAS domain-containing protein [Verrucomicrobiae bacterium]|nr:PAS domain-containing protein [Verrucomicrobiae bacterium]